MQRGQDLEHPLHALVTYAEPDLHRRHRETCAVIADAQIAGEREPQTSAHADAPNPRERRLLARLHRRISSIDGAVVHRRRIAAAALLLEFGYVRARDEGFLTIAGEHHGTHAWVRLDIRAGRSLHIS